MRDSEAYKKGFRYSVSFQLLASGVGAVSMKAVNLFRIIAFLVNKEEIRKRRKEKAFFKFPMMANRYLVYPVDMNL